MKYCTYLTVHQATGKYYIGKGKVALVESGKYKGSGTKLLKAFKKYPPSEWDCAILWEFDTAEEALSDEAALITPEMLADPLCMNLSLGGRGSLGYKYTPEQIATNSRNSKARQNRPEVRAAASARTKRKYETNPELASQHSARMKERMKDETLRAQIADSLRASVTGRRIVIIDGKRRWSYPQDNT